MVKFKAFAQGLFYEMSGKTTTKGIENQCYNEVMTCTTMQTHGNVGILHSGQLSSIPAGGRR